MRELVERQMVDGQASGVGAQGRGRSVTVNLGESAIAWLGARRLIDARQIEAGERLRGDFERAALGPSVTMRWDHSPRAATRGQRGEPMAPALAQIDAKRRFDDAIAGVGPGLSDILWRVVCGNERLPAAEQALGWPTRAGKLVLGLALDRLADHYGLRE